MCFILHVIAVFYNEHWTRNRPFRISEISELISHCRIVNQWNFLAVFFNEAVPIVSHCRAYCLSSVSKLSLYVLYVFWLVLNTTVCVDCICRRSTRILQLYEPSDLSYGVSSVDLDTAPAILMSHYDADSHTIFLTGKVCCYIVKSGL